MIINDKKYLTCIYCNSDIEIEVFEAYKNEIQDGKLKCTNCNSIWPLINGIPRILSTSLLKKLVVNKYKFFFLKYRNHFNSLFKESFGESEEEKIKTAKSFGFEWLKYSKVIKEFEKDWERYFLPFITHDSINGKVVADIGCGLAKQGYFTAKYGAKFIGFDLSEAVEAAYRNTKKYNSLIIQADIYNLPLKGNLVDYYYSIGVLHHLPNPKEGFLKIVELMKKSSKILIWVYGKHRNRRAALIYNPLRAITTRLRKKHLYRLCYIPALITHIFNLFSLCLEKFGAKKIAKKIPFYYYTNFPFSFKVNDSFDILATPTQEYFSIKQIEDWFIKGNFKKYFLKYDIVQGIKGFGIK